MTSSGLFQVDLRGLVDVLSEHLYSSPDVFVRELLQNAVDALTQRRIHDPSHVGRVEMEVRAPAGGTPTLVVTDDGIGLTESEVDELLATIGRSSKRAVAGDAEEPVSFIGQFGIGLLACFLVADEISVVTRSALHPDAPTVRWRGRADGTHDTAVLPTVVTPGTRVHLRARAGREHLLDPVRVLALARHYGSFLPVPVQLFDGTDLHDVSGTPPWEPDAQGHTYASDVLGFDAMETIPLRADGVRGLAFVLPHTVSPAARPAHRVYLKRMLLTESGDRLLPDWAFFLRCVVDVDHLRPTAARDGLRDDDRLDAVREQLGGCVRNHLVELARTHPGLLRSIIAEHHLGIAALAVHDDECLQLFADWLPVQTSLGQMTLGEHTRRFGPELVFVRRVDDFRQIAPMAAAQDRCVVNAGYLYTADMLEQLGRLRPWMSVVEFDPSDVVGTFDEIGPAERLRVQDLLDVASDLLFPLGCAVEIRSFGPDSLPAVLLVTDTARFRRQVDHTRELLATTGSGAPWGGVLRDIRTVPPAGSDTRLCLNARNPVVRALAARAPGGAGRERVRGALHLLYVQALLIGHHPLTHVEFGMLNGAVLDLLASPDEVR